MSAANEMDDDFNGRLRQPSANSDYNFPIPTVIDVSGRVHRDALTYDGDEEWSEQYQYYQPYKQPYHEQPQFISGRQEGGDVDQPAAEDSKEDSSVASNSRDSDSSDGGGFFGPCSPSLKYFIMFVVVMIVAIIIGETSIAKTYPYATLVSPPLTLIIFSYQIICKL